MFGPSDLSNDVETAGMSPDARYGVLHDELVRRLKFYLGDRAYENDVAELLNDTLEASYDSGYDQGFGHTE